MYHLQNCGSYPGACYLASEILILTNRVNPMRTDTSGEVWNRGGHRDFRLVDPLGPGVELDAVKMHKKARSCRFAWYARVRPDLCWLVAAGGTLFLEIYWLIGPQTTSLSGINIHCCLYQNYLTNVCRHLNQANILKSPINKNGTKNKNYGHSYLPLSHLHRVPLFCGHGFPWYPFAICDHLLNNNF